MQYYIVVAVGAVLAAALAGWVRKDEGKGHVRLPAALCAEKPRRVLWVGLAVCSMLLPALLSGLRYGVGTDYFFTYVPAFEKITATGGYSFSELQVEPAFWLLSKAVQLLGGGYLWVFLLTSLVICGAFWLGIFQLSQMPWYSVALFFLAEIYFVSMNAVLQFAGLAIVFFGFRFIQKPCFWKYAICVAVAMLFHLSCAIFLPLYALKFIKLPPLFGLGAIVLLSVLNAPLSQLAAFLVAKTPYAVYVNSSFHAAERAYPEVGRVLVHILVLALALYYYYKNDNENKPLYRFFYYCQLILLFLVLNQNVIPLAPRIGWALEMVHLLFIPMIALSEKDGRVRAGILALVALAWGQLTYNEIFVYGWHEVNYYTNALFWPDKTGIFVL